MFLLFLTWLVCFHVSCALRRECLVFQPPSRIYLICICEVLRLCVSVISKYLLFNNVGGGWNSGRDTSYCRMWDNSCVVLESGRCVRDEAVALQLPSILGLGSLH